MFTTDSRTEQFLNSLGVKWTYTNAMRFDVLASDWDTTNIGRSQVQIDSAIEQYGMLMDKGSAAPAPILYHNTKLLAFQVIDGVQRLLAEYKRNPATFSAYLVETDSAAMVRKLRIFSNYRLQGGHQESAEWTLAQAICWLTNDGSVTIEEIADLGGWSVTSVREKKQCMDCGFSIRAIGGPEKFPDSILRIVAKHSEQVDYERAHEPLSEFFNAIKTMKMSADEAEPYIEQFFCVSRNKGDLYTQFSNSLEEFLIDGDIAFRMADPSRRRYQPMTAEGKLLKSLKAALTTAERVCTSRERIPYIDEYFHVLSQLHATLKQIESNSRRRKGDGRKD